MIRMHLLLRCGLSALAALLIARGGVAQPAAPATVKYYLLQPARVFDGEMMHEGWSVLVRNNQIESVGADIRLPAKATLISLPGMTLLPGMIEGHSHLLLHPYNEATWDEQVLHEPRAERIARAVIHARNTLMAGFTTLRDLGTEGAAFDDVGLKQSIEKGVIPGPHMMVATRAIVATGSYGPKLSTDLTVPQGAAEADGADALVREARTQIGHGADLIKVYADYRWGLDQKAMPTFSIEELEALVSAVKSSGRYVVAHATTAEGMRRAILAGVRTIEHGDEGTPEIFELMTAHKVALCPTLAAGEAISQYKGWRKGMDPLPEQIQQKHKSFEAALKAGVIICFGGDVGVFPHGDNARELELMVEYGMQPVDALRSATSVNATVFGIDGQVGRIKAGLLADLVAVEGNPLQQISDIRKVKFVMKEGLIYRQEP